LHVIGNYLNHALYIEYYRCYTSLYPSYTLQKSLSSIYNVLESYFSDPLHGHNIYIT
jgi:hypothetical protein